VARRPRSRASRKTESQELKELGQAVHRIARHADKLAIALRRLKSGSPVAKRARSTRPKKK
jgi:hypothetical protein